MNEIRFIEDSGSYAHRTKANAQWADITIAIAVDLNTSGEQLTRESAGDKYLGLTIPRGLTINDDRLVKIAIEHGFKAADWIKENVTNPDGVRINLAGNGIRTLARNGITQATADHFMGCFVKALYDRLEAFDFPILEVRSGGQTGIDEAGIKAAHLMNLKCSILAPKDFRMTPAQGEDIYDETAFKERFKHES